MPQKLNIGRLVYICSLANGISIWKRRKFFLFIGSELLEVTTFEYNYFFSKKQVWLKMFKNYLNHREMQKNIF